MNIFFSLIISLLPTFLSASLHSEIYYNSGNYIPEDPVSRKSDSTQSPYSVYENHWDQRQIFAYLGEPRHKIETQEVAEMLKGIAYAIPCAGKVWRGFGKGHKGVDIDLNSGDAVVAAFDGKVRYAMYNKGGFGNLVIVRHPNGLETWYAHLSKIRVKPDDIVQAGQVIGLGGSTGRSRSPHLHLELRYRDVALDLEQFFDLQNQTLTPLVLEGNSFASLQVTEPIAYIAESTNIQDNIQTPLQEETEIQEQWYRIRPGDTLSRIAKIHGTSINTLCKWNNLKPTTVLRIGKSLKVG